MPIGSELFRPSLGPEKRDRNHLFNADVQCRFVFKGGKVSGQLVLKVATWLLWLVFITGLVLAGRHFVTHSKSLPWLGKLHGFAVSAALSLLVFAWINAGLGSAGEYGLLALVAAAAGGLILTFGFRIRQKPLPDGLVFAHICVAFVGFLIIFFDSRSQLIR